jgi:hypothetical protein
MIEKESDSGANLKFPDDRERPSSQSLSRNDCILATEIFNRPPTLTSEGIVKLKEDIETILEPVLVAAFEGVRLCLLYMKNPGRELNMVIDGSKHSLSGRLRWN